MFAGKTVVLSSSSLKQQLRYEILVQYCYMNTESIQAHQRMNPMQFEHFLSIPIKFLG